ncbi:MAG: sel1 repeat family protein, partial [Treponema sp.]|nr:sel1 repeat family protein [Treponema sp.]
EGAFYGLGVCYEFGRGTWMDYGKASEFYQKAADKNYALAQYRLGELYYSGLGVARDKAKAKDLWQKASANGSQEAAKRLKTANF